MGEPHCRKSILQCLREIVISTEEESLSETRFGLNESQREGPLKNLFGTIEEGEELLVGISGESLGHLVPETRTPDALFGEIHAIVKVRRKIFRKRQVTRKLKACSRWEY
jgi:hypothetical protein